ncbi:MAG: hypothetical protein ACRCSQ_03755 [Bacteroidales bacterium]
MKSFIKIYLFAASLSICSCANDMESVSEKPNATTEISFEFDLSGNADSQTKCDPIFPETDCASVEELISYAQAGTLRLDITIGTTEGDMITHERSYVSKIVWSNNRFVAEPISFIAGSYAVTQAIVSNLTPDNRLDLLYSAVDHSSAYAKYVKEPLPVYFKVGNNKGDVPLYKKHNMFLYMLCVMEENPQDFGFIKWNINFAKIYSLPFAINICNSEGEDFVGRGILTIQYGIFKDGSFHISEDYQPDVITFPKTNTSLAKMNFADHYIIDNKSEGYRFSLEIKEPEYRIFSADVNLQTLIDYKNSNAWDAYLNLLHFNFCTGEIWFFYNSTPL